MEYNNYSFNQRKSVTKNFQDKEFPKIVEALAEEIKAQASDLRFNSLVSFTYTADIMNRYLDIELRKYGTGRTYFNILHTLITHGGMMTPTELSRRVIRSKHAITRAVDSLEKEGLVARQGIGSDRRMREVAITKEGLDFIKQAMPDRQDVSFRVMSCLNKQEAQEFNTTLTRLRKHILSLK